MNHFGPMLVGKAFLNLKPKAYCRLNRCTPQPLVESRNGLMAPYKKPDITKQPMGLKWHRPLSHAICEHWEVPSPPTDLFPHKRLFPKKATQR